MPGTIHVSVLDFKGISISSIQIKASMGKAECQIWEKGDFSFPLTTLRDNLIITLEDAEGNQISHAGVRTMSIVEKVVWDDLFPLDGGGHIHMKLQFVLSDEERNRIRMMREAALKKKKQREMLNSAPGEAETASNSTTSSLRTNEVSDSRMSSDVHNGDIAVRADPLPKPDTSSSGESRSASEAGTLQSQATPNAARRKEATSSSPISEGDGVPRKQLVVKEENELPHPDVQVGAILSQEASSSSGSSEAVAAEKKSVSSRLGNDQTEKLEKPSPVHETHSDVKEKSEGREILLVKKSQTPQVQHADISTRLKESSQEIELPKSVQAENFKPLPPKVSDENEKLGKMQKAPSNIRKMISAFESSLAQEREPATKALAVKSQSNRVGMVRLLKDQALKGATEMSESSSGRLENPAVPSLGRLKNSFSAGDLQRTPANIQRRGEQTGFQKDFSGFRSSQSVKQLTESSATKFQPKGIDTSILKDKLGPAHSDLIPNELDKSLEDTKRLLSSTEEATVSARLHKERDSARMSIVKNEFGSTKELNTKELARSDSIMGNEVRSVDKEINTTDLPTSDSMRPSTLEAAKVSGKIHEVGERDYSGTSFVKQEIRSAQKETNKKGMGISPRDLTTPTLEAGALSATIGEQQDSSGKSVAGGRERRISSTKSSNINNRGTSKDDLGYFPNERSGTWIFPDDRRYLCITAEGDKVTNSLRGRVVQGNSHQRNKIHIEPEKIEKDMVQCGTNAEVENIEEKSKSSRNSEQERSEDDGSTGPLGQIIKIAVLVGFGLLVLLTRQRQPRHAKGKDTDPPFGIENFIDHKLPIEEQLKKLDIF